MNAPPDCRKPRLPVLKALAVPALFATGIAFPLPSVAHLDGQPPSEAQQKSVTDTVNLCFDLPDTVEGAAAAFTEIGWSNGNPDESPTAPRTELEALVGAVVVGRFRAEDLYFTVGNALSVANSVLEQSDLGPNQVGLIWDEATIAVLGIEEGTPYCAISGPAWIVIAAEEAGLKPQLEDSSDTLMKSKGRIAQGAFSMGIILDFDTFLISAVAAIKYGEGDGEKAEVIKTLLNPASIIITPQSTLERLGR